MIKIVLDNGDQRVEIVNNQLNTDCSVSEWLTLMEGALSALGYVIKPSELQLVSEE
jgi:hypothetical protein